MKKYLIGAGALVALASVAWAQPLVQQSLSGNEVVVVEAGGPGGSGFFASVASLRGGHNYSLVAAGGTVGFTVPNNTSEVIITGAITVVLNLQMPLIPYDGQTVMINCPGGTITSAVVTYTPGTLVGTAYTACTAGGTAAQGAKWVYSLSNTTWYRVQ